MPLTDVNLARPTAGHTLIATLDTCSRTGWIGLAVMLQAALGACLLDSWPQWIMAAVIVPGLAGQYLAMRLSLDAELFRVLYRHDADAAVFERTLDGLLGREASTDTPRDMASRWRGTQRLIHRFGWCLGLELAVWIAAMIVTMAS